MTVIGPLSSPGRSGSPGRSPSRSPPTVYRPSALSPSPSPPVCFVRNPNENEALAGLNATYGKLRDAVEQRLPLYGRGLQIRIRQWLEKLDEDKSTTNTTWARNRNNYMQLLNGHLRQGRVQKPFESSPPLGPLPTLPKHLTYSYAGKQAGNGTQSPPRGGGEAEGSPGRASAAAGGASRGGRRSPGPSSAPHQAAAAAQKDAPPGRKQGTKGVSRQQQQQGLSSPPLQFRSSRDPGLPSSSPHGSGHDQQQQQQPPAAAWPRAQSPYSQLDASSQREALSRMEWQLGASRERQLELEAQLSSSRAVVRQQAEEISALRDEIAALKEDNSLLAVAASAAANAPPAAPNSAQRPQQQQQQQQSPLQPTPPSRPCERRGAREGLDRVISQVEATRQGWERQKTPPPQPPLQQHQQQQRQQQPGVLQPYQSPNSAPPPHPSAPPPAMNNISNGSAIVNASGSHGASWEFDGDDDFLRHLEEFQKRTDALQGQISRMQVSSSATGRAP